MVRQASSSLSFVCKQCKEKSAESHWTDTLHLFKDCYSGFADIENTPERNASDVPVEAECIAIRENSEASTQNLEDSSSTQDQQIMQDQDIGQEKIQKRMEPENEINI